MKFLAYLAPFAFLASCSTSEYKPVHVERIAAAHQKELGIMLKKYPATTMDMLQTIALLEDRIAKRKPAPMIKNWQLTP